VDHGTRKGALELVEVEIHHLDRDLSLLITPDGGQLHVKAPVAELRAWVARCDGTRTRAQLLAGMSPDYLEVVDVLDRAGCLRPPRTVDGSGQAARTTVLVTGAPQLTGLLAHALGTAGYARVARAPECLEGADVRDTVLVAAYTHPAYAELTRVDDLCARLGLRWLPLRRERGRVVLGPAITPGASADFADVLARRLTAARDPRVVEALTCAGVADVAPLRTGDARWVAAQVAAHLERWVTGEAAVGEVELDPRELTQVRRTVLPVPTRPRPVVPGDLDDDRDPDDPGAAAGLLVDEQVGVVTGVREPAPLPGMPARLRVCAAEVADMRRIADWPNDRHAFGASWSGAAAARHAALGAAVARYCGSRPPGGLRYGSHAQLTRAGVPALDPRRLHLYSARQYRTDGFPFAPLTVDAECAWVEGRSWTTDEPVWVPAFLVSHGESDPVRYSHPVVAGAASAAGEEQAVTAGLEEVIGRDTAMLWWANAVRLPRLPLPDRLHALLADGLDAHEVTIIPLDNEFDVPVVAAAVLDGTTRRLAIGVAARPDALAAAEAALAEGFVLHHTYERLDDERTQAAGRRHPGELKPYRPDRRYLDSYRSDFADVRDLVCQQQIHLDPRAARRVAPRVRDLPTRSWVGLPALGERRLKAYLDRVEHRGFEVISVDLTTCDVEAAGFTVAHTVVPGMVSPFPAGLPLWGTGRIGRAAVDLGWRRAPLADEDLDVFPFPHP
jgi:ribosomal protein S12 methylthiotransferase accessory factor